MTMTVSNPTPEAIVAEAQAELVEGGKALVPVRMSNVSEPRDFQQLERFSVMVARSKMFGVTSEADAFVRIAAGMQLGISAIGALMNIDAIPGADGSPRPSLRARLKVALCLQSPLCEYFRCVETTPERATFVAKRQGEPERSFTYTISDAERAGYTKKNNWKENPAAMLRARASGTLADLEFPDVTCGIATSEDMRDLGPGQVSSQAWPVDDVGERRAAELLKAIEGAKTATEFGKAWDAAKKAKESGDITEAQLDAMKPRAKELNARFNPPKDSGKTPPNGSPTPAPAVST